MWAFGRSRDVTQRAIATWTYAPSRTTNTATSAPRNARRAGGIAIIILSSSPRDAELVARDAGKGLNAEPVVRRQFEQWQLTHIQLIRDNVAHRAQKHSPARMRAFEFAEPVTFNSCRDLDHP